MSSPDTWRNVCRNFRNLTMDNILKKFTEILCGTLDNQAQVDRERYEGKQIHPYARHVTDICDHKIINRPEGHEGLYILEESYYVKPGAEIMELKPLLFYMRSDGDSKALLNSVQIPPQFTKEQARNDNKYFIMDFKDLEIRNFGTAEYELQVDGSFKVDHEADMGGGIVFRLIETLSLDGLDVMELVHKDGIKLTPYDTPIEYRRVSG